MEESAIYEGWVRHRRFGAVSNAFRYGTYMAYLDLGALESESLPKSIQVRFFREDHSGDPSAPLSDFIRDQAEVQLGFRSSGPIFLLTHLRQAGYVFNPVSFYYLWSTDGQRLEAVIAEVHNTPWGETHLYAVPFQAAKTTYQFPKAFHVSPFMEMGQDYRWTFTIPARSLVVHMTNIQGGQPVFDASLVLTRRSLDAQGLRRAAWRHPFENFAVIARIYIQALRLWVKGARYVPHPQKAATREGSK